MRRAGSSSDHAVDLVVAVLVALMLALALSTFARAQEEEDEYAIYVMGLCQRLEPWSYWWYFFDCLHRSDDCNECESGSAGATSTSLASSPTVAETYSLTYQPDGDVLVVYERVTADGRVHRATHVSRRWGLFRRGAR